MIIAKTVPPNKLINEPYGTIHIVDNDGKKEYFIQVHTDINTPHWIPMGDFLLTIFEKELSNKEFMESCLQAYSKS